jgi:ATP-dependent RNA helicase DeaD
MSTADSATEKLDKLQRKITGDLKRQAELSNTAGAQAASRDSSPKQQFAVLNLRAEVLQAIVDTGYHKPTAVQLQTIPHVLAGRDLLAQAETGSGKTAAFACPLLSMIDLKRKQPQVLVLTPTRELAIQVTAAIETYAAHLRGFRALTIYGGQSYDIQLNALKRGVHVVVGTPGRVMDHMRRNTLKLQELKCLVLDEADEMLRMGFVDDVEWILTMTPQQRQILLFSATLPAPIRRIASQHLRDPQQITVKGRTMTADAIEQRYVETAAKEKPDTLIRILAAEPTDGVIVFVRTRNNTVEIAEKLTDAGYSAAPLNGDMPQSLRERTVQNFRQKRLAVLVATDVAARGLDVERVSHVINYDFPNDFEAYIHRIGRTGRAGRSGHAILFVGQREKGQLRRLEGAIGQRLERMSKPSIEAINEQRIANFKEQIIATATNKDLSFFTDLIEEITAQTALDHRQIAAALAQLVHGDTPLLIKASTRAEQRERYDAPLHGKPRTGNRPSQRDRAGQDTRAGRHGTVKRPRSALPERGMQAYRVEVGRSHGIEPKNIVGAIANESGIDSTRIGRIEIHDLHSTVDLPDNLDDNFFRSLNGVRIAGQELRLARIENTRAAKSRVKKSAPPRTVGESTSARKKPRDKDRAKVKAKSKRTNKDKGKRRKPTSSRPE